MDEAYGADLITVSDDDGNEYELELLNTFQYKDATYSVFLPADIADMETSDPDFGFIFLKNQEEDGMDVFGSIDDEKELEEVYEYYMDSVYEDEDTPDGENEE